jgi:hypothetical protein
MQKVDVITTARMAMAINDDDHDDHDDGHAS